MASDILEGCGDLLARYDLLVCDLWGVVHDGVRAHEDACEALIRFRQSGGTVVLLSNAPMPSRVTARFIERIGVPRAAYDRLVTSGDLTLDVLAGKGIGRVHHMGPEKRDDALFETIERVPLARAQAIVCSGLEDDVNETAEHYRDRLFVAREAELVLVCANPDLSVEVGGVSYPCAGAIAALYEEIGGEVIWCGKPHSPAYVAAFAAGEAARGRAVERSRILGIGDALRTDIAGAALAGIDALLIASGLHRREVWTNDALDPAKARALVSSSGLPCRAVSARLIW
jgi:HAD superfamily hydrolase (TIGR01459 family)